jgi:hypothetical protein
MRSLTTLTLIALATSAGCSAAAPPGKLPTKVPDELICKVNLLLNLPRNPEAIDFNAVKELIEGVRGCDAIHFDAGP